MLFEPIHRLAQQLKSFLPKREACSASDLPIRHVLKACLVSFNRELKAYAHRVTLRKMRELEQTTLLNEDGLAMIVMHYKAKIQEVSESIQKAINYWSSTGISTIHPFSKVLLKLNEDICDHILPQLDLFPLQYALIAVQVHYEAFKQSADDPSFKVFLSAFKAFEKATADILNSANDYGIRAILDGLWEESRENTVWRLIQNLGGFTVPLEEYSVTIKNYLDKSYERFYTNPLPEETDLRQWQTNLVHLADGHFKTIHCIDQAEMYFHHLQEYHIVCNQLQYFQALPKSEGAIITEEGAQHGVGTVLRWKDVIFLLQNLIDFLQQQEQAIYPAAETGLKFLLLQLQAVEQPFPGLVEILEKFKTARSIVEKEMFEVLAKEILPEGLVVSRSDDPALLKALFPKIDDLPSFSEEAVKKRYFEEYQVVVSQVFLDCGKLLRIALMALEGKDPEGELESQFRALLLEFGQQLIHLRKIDAIVLAPTAEMVQAGCSSYSSHIAQLTEAYAAQRDRIVERFTVCLESFETRKIDRLGMEAFQDACLGLNYFYDFFVEQFAMSPDAVELLREKDELVLLSRRLQAENVELHLRELRVCIRELTLAIGNIDEKIKQDAREEMPEETELKACLRAELTECESALVVKELSGTANALLPSTDDGSRQYSVPRATLMSAHSDVFATADCALARNGNTENALCARSASHAQVVQMVTAPVPFVLHG